MDLSEMMAHFVNLQGGPRRMAKMLHDELSRTKEGSLARVRMFDLVIWMMRQTADKNGPRDDLGLLSDEDLEKKLAEHLVGMQRSLHDAEQEDTRGDRSPAAGQEDAAWYAEGSGI